jgi:HSP20 family molecular chaperone IbpA
VSFLRRRESLNAVAERGGGDLTPLAAALDLEPPYRAEAVRRNQSLWALAARTIEVVELPGVDGEEIELASHGGERTLRIDGERVFGSVPALERDGHVVRARRVAGEAWEVETDPL